MTTAAVQIECEGCGLIQMAPAVGPGESAYCGQCGQRLYHGSTDSIDRTLALTISALILLVIANGFLFMVFDFKGRSETNRMLTGVLGLWQLGYTPLSLLIGFTSIFAPALHLTGMLFVLVPVKLGRSPAYLGPLFRWLGALRPWSMLEVYLLGAIVAIVKLGQLASIELDLAFYAFVGLIVVSTASHQTLDPRQVWSTIRLPRSPSEGGSAPGEIALACSSCGLLSRLPHKTAEEAQDARCPRCQGRLHGRKPHSLQRTCALVIAASLLYIPANYYPVLIVEFLGDKEPNTILGGVEELITSGMWEIGILVFIASIVVPMLKLVGLTFLMISVHWRWRWSPRDRTHLYRVIEYIGRWSMIDMFMTSILVALVQLGALATIDPGVGATCFGAVVVLTMFAASGFDPRLVWDALEETDE
jgi:paraquat-inducible protein A